MNRNVNKTRLRALCITGLMGALGAVLMFLEFPLPMLIPPFIKMDFSELPALLTAFTVGPFYGVAVCLIKNCLHLFAGSTMGIGEASNFILGSVFVLTAGLIYKHKNTKKGAVAGSLTGALVMGLVSVFSNFCVVYPLYCKVLGFTTQAILAMYRELLPGMPNLFVCLLVFNLPFTVVKGLADAVLTGMLYKPLSPVMKKSQ